MSLIEWAGSGGRIRVGRIRVGRIPVGRISGPDQGNTVTAIDGAESDTAQ
ncbi:hypothetical protein RCH11_002824 [Glaciihabitans sp. GrIS 2.15]|nr:hypothetical protein [Glaciihabitans sp. GrIS 2.15]